MKSEVAYISGPISGLSNGNFDTFQRAQKELEEEGYIIINPHEIGKELYKELSEKDKINTLESWIKFMKLDIRHLTLCDVVFVLDGWETSKGCLIELFVSQKLNMPIYNFKDRTEFKTYLRLEKDKPVIS